MNNLLRKTLYCIFVVVFIGCGSDDEGCTKTITIPQFFIINNQSYRNDITQEVPCEFPESTEPELIEPPFLNDFSFEVLFFEFTPDTGNNTSRLQFEIRLDNPNDFDITGVPIITLEIDGLETSGSYSNMAIEPCLQIDANSSCVLSYDQEESLDLALIDNIVLINVQYVLTN